MKLAVNKTTTTTTTTKLWDYVMCSAIFCLSNSKKMPCLRFRSKQNSTLYRLLEYSLSIYLSIYLSISEVFKEINKTSFFQVDDSDKKANDHCWLSTRLRIFTSCLPIRIQNQISNLGLFQVCLVRFYLNIDYENVKKLFKINAF